MTRGTHGAGTNEAGTNEAVILRREDGSRVVLDLAGVAFIDSSGRRSLLGAGRRD
jgi:anti-anti-sigma regulatory factor